MNINNITGALTQGGDSVTIAQLAAHLASTSNPHSVTASQVGLGNVSNYAIASQAEAEAGSSNVKYMTPLRVAEFFANADTLDDLVGGDALTFTAGTNTLDVNVDGSTIEVSADALQLKDDGVTGAKLAPAVAGNGLVQDGSGNLGVGAGNGITVNANDVALASSSAGSGLTYTTGVLSVNVGEGIFIESNTLKVDDSVGGAGLSASNGVISVNVGEGIFIESDTVKLADSVGGDGLTALNGVISVNVGTNLAIDGDNVDVVDNPTFSGLLTANAGITVADGQNFRLNNVNLSAVSTANSGSGLTNGTVWTGQAVKEYVDAKVQGLDSKDAVDCATTANITLSGEQTIDGVLTSSSRVLVKDQSTASQNGIYVSAAGAWTRATDMDSGNEFAGAYIPVDDDGSSNGGTLWLCTNSSDPTVGSTAITFTQINGASNVVAGDGLAKSGNTLSVNTSGGLEVAADNVQIADSGVTTVKIADSNVTTAKIADSNVTTAKINDSAVTTAKILDANVTTAKIADSNVTTAKIADSNVTTAKIADSNVTTAKIADSNVTTAKIADANVTTDKLADDSVTGAKLAPAVAGVALAQDGSGNLDVQVDGVTIEVTADALNVKNDSIGQSKIDFATLAATAAQTKAGSATEVFVEPAKMLVLNASDATDALHSRSATASGDYAGAFGRSTASASDSFAGGRATASGVSAAAFGAVASTASGDNALSAGAGVASGDYATAFGTSTASRYGETAFGTGSYGNQQSFFVLSGRTTNGSETELYLDGAGEQLILSNSTAWNYVIRVNGVNEANISERMTYVVEGTCERGANAASTAVSGTNNTRILRDDDADWDFAISADTTNGALKVTATGEAAKNIRWSADVFVSQLQIA